MAFILRRQLTRLYLRVAHLVMPPSVSDDVLIPRIPPGKDASEPRGILTCHDYHQKAYHSVEDMKNSEVVQVEWYKCTYRLKHEYGVATVKRAGITYYIRFERTCGRALQAIDRDAGPFGEEVTRHVAPTPQMRLEMQEDVEAEKKALPNMSWTSYEGSEISKREYEAYDTLTRVASSDGMHLLENGGSNLLAAYNFQPGSFFLRDLILVLYEVNRTAPDYKLRTSQCYWFMNAVIGTLEQKYNPTVNQAEDFNKAGTYWVGIGLRNIKLSYKIVTDNIVDVQRLAGVVQEKIEEHNAILYEIYMNGEGGRLQEREGRLQEREGRLQEREGRLQAEEALRQAQEMIKKLTASRESA